MVIPSATTNPARPGLTSELLGLPSFFIAKIFSQTPPSPPFDLPLGVFQFALLFALKRLLIHWLIDWFTAGLINNQWIYFRTTILDSVARANSGAASPVEPGANKHKHKRKACACVLPAHTCFFLRLCLRRTCEPAFTLGSKTNLGKSEHKYIK